MPFGSFTTTYSLNVKVTCVPLTETLVEPGAGETLTILGGIVSFRPPVGAWVVFAQECENMVIPITITTGIRGKYLFKKLLSISGFLSKIRLRVRISRHSGCRRLS